MSISIKKLSACMVALSIAVPQPTFAQSVNFGDDRSQFARDGECDDKRFSGPGMTDTPLLDSDVGHDATDCRAAYNQGRIQLRSGSSRRNSSGIIWGNDSGAWANDGECDDMRFVGPGMTSTPLLESDVKKDATDCRSAYEAGRLQLRS